MHNLEQTIALLGNEPPLMTGGRSGPPDRREVSARWLSGTFLTGVTSAVLMGVALVAALDGREQLATPPEIAELDDMASDTGEAAKAPRVIATHATNRTRDRRRMEVSTVTREGDRDLIRTLPFVEVRMPLAAAYTTNRDYPPFDPLDVFSEEGAATALAPVPGLIYGAKVESEVSLKTVDFPVDTASFDEKSSLSGDEVEEVVRQTGAILTDGEVQVAALHYVDPQRFGESLATATLSQSSYGVRIVQENVSVAHQDRSSEPGPVFAEEILIVRNERPLTELLADSGYPNEDAVGMADAIGRLLNTTALKPGSVLRLGVESSGDETRIVRTSLYERSEHILTIAVDDQDQFVPADEPEQSAEIAAAFNEERPPVRVRGDLPKAYDGIYRAAYSYGMSHEMTKQLIRMLAADVDFQARIGPTDRIDVFFSQPNEDNTASEESQLLYVNATFGGNTRTFYRFQMADGTVDYFDTDGRSARQFLLRNPLPNGRFTSGFGRRRHPILGYVKMHTGVDWAAPTGTPIIAAGNGTVEKAGWAGGYGRQTILKHANGYKTSYNHQSRIAKGVVPGAKVRQGQVIGYVGSTGLSTGAHLHYELMVNGTRVDPMRVRLPTGRVLKDEELAAFNRERERIDALLGEDDESSVKLASR